MACQWDPMRGPCESSDAYTRTDLERLARECGVAIRRAPPLRGRKTVRELCADLTAHMAGGARRRRRPQGSDVSALATRTSYAPVDRTALLRSWPEVLGALDRLIRLWDALQRAASRRLGRFSDPDMGDDWVRVRMALNNARREVAEEQGYKMPAAENRDALRRWADTVPRLATRILVTLQALFASMHSDLTTGDVAQALYDYWVSSLADARSPQLRRELARLAVRKALSGDALQMADDSDAQAIVLRDVLARGARQRMGPYEPGTVDLMAQFAGFGR